MVPLFVYTIQLCTQSRLIQEHGEQAAAAPAWVTRPVKKAMPIKKSQRWTFLRKRTALPRTLEAEAFKGRVSTVLRVGRCLRLKATAFTVPDTITLTIVDFVVEKILQMLQRRAHVREL